MVRMFVVLISVASFTLNSQSQMIEDTETSKCQSFASQHELYQAYGFRIEEGIDIRRITVCSVNEVNSIFAIISNPQGSKVCSFKVQRYLVEENKLKEAFNPGIYYALKEESGCPVELEYTELTNISSFLKIESLLTLLSEFKFSVVNDSEGLSKFLALSIWDKLFNSNLKDFFLASIGNKDIKITNVSRYLLSDDEHLHVVSIVVGQDSWTLLAEISNDSFQVKKISPDT